MGHSMNVHVLLFLVYSFIGWLIEVIFHFIKKKKFVNRGFLKGPVCPIYGTGAMLVILTVEPLRDNLLLFTIGAFLVPTLLELFVGISLHTIFKTRWWNYSNRKYHYKGYVSLLFSSLWGAFVFVFIWFFHPGIRNLLMGYPESDVSMATVIAFSLFAIDVVFTIYKLIDFKASLEAVKREKEELALLIASRVDRAEAIFLEKMEFYQDHIEQLIKRQRRFFNSYPELSSNYFRDVLKDIKATILVRIKNGIHKKK